MDTSLKVLERSSNFKLPSIKIALEFLTVSILALLLLHKDGIRMCKNFGPRIHNKLVTLVCQLSVIMVLLGT